jgi:hypothetical protein
MLRDCKQGSGPREPRGEALCQRLHDSEVVIAVLPKIPSGHQAAPRHMYASHQQGTLRVVRYQLPGSCRTNMDHKISIGEKL